MLSECATGPYATVFTADFNTGSISFSQEYNKTMSRTLANKHFVLYTSVASLILDGDLWERYPSVLLGYKADLQAALFHQEEEPKRRLLKDLPTYSPYLQRAISAHNWSKKIVSDGSPKLLLPPTAQVELTMAPQFEHQNWADFSDVGMTELYGKEYHNIRSQDVSNVLSSLEGELMQVLVPRHLSDAESKAIEPAVQLFKSKVQLERMHNDVKIYVEACIARKTLDEDIVVLVTDDHQFLRTFAQSPIAEQILLSQVETVIEAACYTRKGVHAYPSVQVKNASELIPGM